MENNFMLAFDLACCLKAHADDPLGDFVLIAKETYFD